MVPMRLVFSLLVGSYSKFINNSAMIVLLFSVRKSGSKQSFVFSEGTAFCFFISLTKLLSCGLAACLCRCFSGGSNEEEEYEGGNDEE